MSAEEVAAAFIGHFYGQVYLQIQIIISHLHLNCMKIKYIGYSTKLEWISWFICKLFLHKK